jgi:hypothetical protein
MYNKKNGNRTTNYSIITWVKQIIIHFSFVSWQLSMSISYEPNITKYVVSEENKRESKVLYVTWWVSLNLPRNPRNNSIVRHFQYLNNLTQNDIGLFLKKVIFYFLETWFKVETTLSWCKQLCLWAIH